MWFVSQRDTVRSLFVSTELTLANPKREWSMKTVQSPIFLAWKRASWAMAEKELCEWIIVTLSRTNMYLSNGRLRRRVVALDWLYITFRSKVIDFEAFSELTDAFSISISMGDNYDFVSSFNQALRELVNVAFHAAHIRVEKVRHHAYIMGPSSTRENISRANVVESS